MSENPQEAVAAVTQEPETPWGVVVNIEGQSRSNFLKQAHIGSRGAEGVWTIDRKMAWRGNEASARALALLVGGLACEMPPVVRGAGGA